jgi:hypothetical protein
MIISAMFIKRKEIITISRIADQDNTIIITTIIIAINMEDLLYVYEQVPLYIKLVLIFWAICLISFVIVYPFALYHSVREFFGWDKKNKPSKF